MQRFTIVAVTQFAITWAAIVVMAGPSADSWFSAIARLFFVVLVAPIGWVSMWLASYMREGISLAPVVGVNALFWSAAICWCMSRRSQVAALTPPADLQT